MRRKLFSLPVVLALVLVNSGWAGDKYQVDVAHSNIGFTVRHMLIAKVSGQFKDYSVDLVYDESDITKSSVQVTIKVASVDTENERRDGHLKSPDFFDAENHPEIKFISKKIVKTETGYVAVGDLTIRGVTKEVELPFEILGKIKDQRGNTRIGIEASLTLNRFDYDVKWDRKLDTGGLVAGEEVKILVNLEMIASQS